MCGRPYKQHGPTICWTEQENAPCMCAYISACMRVRAYLSSLSSSSTEVGILRMPPKVVRCVVAQMTPFPSMMVVTPSLLHASCSSLQKLQSSETEHCASMKPGGQTHRPSMQLPRPLQAFKSEQSPIPYTSRQVALGRGTVGGRGGWGGRGRGGGDSMQSIAFV